MQIRTRDGEAHDLSNPVSRLGEIRFHNGSSQILYMFEFSQKFFIEGVPNTKNKNLRSEGRALIQHTSPVGVK